MRRIRQVLTTGNVIGALALFVALGGGAYAAIGAGTQTITVCVHKKGGGLYKASRCASGDSALSWNRVGPRGLPGRNGTTIVARARSAGPLTASNTAQGDRLTGNAWTQAPNELDTLVGQATIQEPSSTDCGAMGLGELTGSVNVDGNQVGSLGAFAPGSGQTQTMALGFSEPNLFEPGTAIGHVLTLQIQDNCTGSSHFVVKRVAIDVEAAH